MTALWTSADVAAATGGRVTTGFAATGVSIDTRSLAAGDLFIAIKDARDGHDFVADAFARGAAAAMVSETPRDVGPEAPLLHVEDTLAGLRSLGNAGRQRSSASVVAVTGSVGKTSTKEALAAVLGAQGPTHAAAASFNNHLGVPLTLARLPQGALFAVVEIGMNHPGEIAPLARLAAPHVALITTVEAVHIAHFESEEAIADEKGAIMEGLVPGGAVVLNRDNRHFARLTALAHARGVGRIITFGTDPMADVRLLSWQAEGWSMRVHIGLLGREYETVLASPGVHAARNACGVLATVFAAGADPAAALPVLAAIAPAGGRGRRRTIPLPGGEATLLDDSYNASPPSVRAALAVLGTAPAARRIAVLGDMLELGERAEQDHRALAEPIAAAGIDSVFCCGGLMRGLYDALPARLRGGYAADSTALLPLVRPALLAGDVVLVKGSLGSRMGPLAAALAGDAPGGAKG
ncbi:UDP-N-acetylmuramoylalanyl-D-glutamyl-2,6-diaminopimelate--D-alanyl-D-alanine ligase [Elioraea sp.]|uniref:UDP-N-acetylmuramoylalanyl-D-glutamyl-2, 6-diaminopimelate--D-alanyl-D-alanine ligase n=1 Tax=Elioraea sp. TaxID=2185103 RepID=UPI0025C50F9E|nr:UDP-N-acetylmuramoylalanyl-D-glutamyl-2,6-diaminopimelate--D-alanyl-D-alanine ligase [Elioraea sp.]